MYWYTAAAEILVAVKIVAASPYVICIRGAWRGASPVAASHGLARQTAAWRSQIFCEPTRVSPWRDDGVLAPGCVPRRTSPQPAQPRTAARVSTPPTTASRLATAATPARSSYAPNTRPLLLLLPWTKSTSSSVAAAAAVDNAAAAAGAATVGVIPLNPSSCGPLHWSLKYLSYLSKTIGTSLSSYNDYK